MNNARRRSLDSKNMSCSKCELIRVSGYRPGIVIGDVELVGCREHIQEVMKLVRYANQHGYVGPDTSGSHNGDNIRETGLRG
jgi:hypothetical protein